MSTGSGATRGTAGSASSRRARTAFSRELDLALARFGADSSVGNEELRRLYAVRAETIGKFGGTAAATLDEQSYPNPDVEWVDRQFANTAVQLVSGQVTSIAAKWHRDGGDLKGSEAWGEGSATVYKALLKYNPAKGKFTSYVHKSLERDMRRAVIRSETQLSEAEFAERKRVLSYVDEFYGERGRKPSPQEVAAALGVAVPQAAAIMGPAGTSPVPISSAGAEDPEWLDRAGTPLFGAAGPDGGCEDAVFRDPAVVGELLIYAKGLLTEEEYLVFTTRWRGVVDGEPEGEPASFDEVGVALGEHRGGSAVSRETARRTYESAAGKLMHPLTRRRLLR